MDLQPAASRSPIIEFGMTKVLAVGQSSSQKSRISCIRIRALLLERTMLSESTPETQLDGLLIRMK